MNIFRAAPPSVLLALLTVFYAGPLWAKRAAPPDVSPVRQANLEFRAPNTLDQMGMVEVWDVARGTKLKELRIYHISRNPLLEEDAQWIFIKSLTLDWPTLIVTTERGKVYRVKVTGLGHP